MGDSVPTKLDVWMTEKGVSNAVLAEIAGTTTEAVRLWRLGRRLPGQSSVRLLLADTGLNLPRHVIRPDLWDDPSAGLSGASSSQGNGARRRRPLAATSST